MDRHSIIVMVASQRRELLPALMAVLAGEPDLRVAGSGPSLRPDLEAAQSPDVLLADEALLRRDEAALDRLRRRTPHLRVLAWCDQCTDALVATILEHRFHGFVLARDPSPTVLKAMRAVHGGDVWMPRAVLVEVVRRCLPTRTAGDAPSGAAPELAGATQMLTRREAEVVRHLRQGFTNKQIGRELGIMEDTVKKHLTSVFSKLGVHRRGLVIARRVPFL